jgi:hypothetical protein
MPPKSEAAKRHKWMRKVNLSFSGLR